jgi:hypothetical protein
MIREVVSQSASAAIFFAAIWIADFARLAEI